MEVVLDDGQLTELETHASDIAREAGKILHARFRGPLEVKYKDDNEQDPVTSADLESQTYLSGAIGRRYPEHGIVGEEGEPGGEVEDARLPDFFWVLDPLDGTTNFLNGLPLYAVSVALLHRGNPLVGALFIPWPDKEGGVVLHARRGGGAWMDGEPISIGQPAEQKAKGLAGVPGSFGSQFRLRKGLHGRAHDVRVTGSIAYELALTCCGAFQFVVFGGPKIWDVAAGALVVVEAGGSVLLRRRRSRRWEPCTILGPSWESGPPRLKEVRQWTAPLIAGNGEVVPTVAANLRSRHPLSRRVSGLIRKLGHKGR